MHVIRTPNRVYVKQRQRNIGEVRDNRGITTTTEQDNLKFVEKIGGVNYIKVSARARKIDAIHTKKEFEKNGGGKLIIKITPFKCPYPGRETCYYIWARTVEGLKMNWQKVVLLALYGKRGYRG